MRKQANIFIVAIMLLLVVAIAVTAVIVVQKGPFESPNIEKDLVNKYNFKRQIEIDGKQLEFYQSGNQHFKYDHDVDGFVLIPSDNNKKLKYLTKVNGEIVESDVLLGEDKSGIDKVVASELDPNDKRFKIEPIEIKSQNRLVYSNEQKSIKNLVVYVQFQGESATNPYTSPSNMIKFSDIDNFYKKLTQNRISIDSASAKDGTDTYIHTASKNREYFNVKDSTSTERREREFELVKGIFDDIKTKYNFTDSQLDQLGGNGVPDGFIDSVSIYITGSKEPVWGGLLWPHKWNIRQIKDGVPESDYPKIGTKKFGDYTVNFIDSTDIGTVCHEMGHVLGAPDYYHYNNDFVPVGEWDLMSYNKLTPQYMLTHTRDKYLKSIKPTQIQTIESSGTYTAYATTLSRTEGLGVGKPIAYKINTGKSDEYIMLEMRAQESYDSVLPGSGLIIYRVKTGVEGNQDAVYKRTDKPDEVFVYRPEINHTASTPPNQRHSASYNDAKQAYLSTYNARFSSIGKSIDPTDKSKYKADTIYYNDGTNTGIKIVALSTASNNIRFRVSLPGDATTQENIFDKFTMINAELFQDSLGGGVRFSFNVGQNLNLNLLKNVQAILKSPIQGQDNFAVANIDIDKFKLEYRSGKTAFEGRFYLGSPSNPDNIFHHTKVMTGNATSEDEYPQSVTLVVFDVNNNYSADKDATINKAGQTWSKLVKIYPDASIYASDTMSVALDSNGIARTNIPQGHDGHAPVDSLNSKWNIEGRGKYISIALGYDHVLALTKDFTVEAFGYNYSGETGARGWSNILAIAAGSATSYGLTVTGRVLALGDNSSGQLNVQGWENIASIYAYRKHVAGITNDAKLKVAGLFSDELKAVLEAQENVNKIALGENYAVVLYKNGTVKAFSSERNLDSLNTSLGTIGAIKKVSATGSSFWLLTNDGRVLKSSNINDTQNEIEVNIVSDLIDIIDLSCASFHAMFLREDGLVEYIGQNDIYKTNVDFSNLIYSQEEFREVTDIEIRDSFGFSMPTKIDIEYKETTTEQGYIHLTMKSISSNQNLATYKRLVYSTSAIDGKLRGDIDVVVEKHPKTGNEPLANGEDVTIWKLIAKTKGFLRLHIRAHGTNISRAIDIEIDKFIPLSGIIIEGTKLDTEGNPDLSVPSIFIKEYPAQVQGEPPVVPPVPVQLKIRKDPIDALGSRTLPYPTYTVEPTNLININAQGKIVAIQGANLSAQDQCTITATLMFLGQTYTTQTIIKVVSTISKIDPVYPTGMTAFNLMYDSELPYDLMQIKVTPSEVSQVATTMSVNPSMVDITTFNKRTLGVQEVTVSYFNRTCKFNVSINDYIKNISLVSPKTRYKLATSLADINPNVDIGQIICTKASGEEPIISSFNSKPLPTNDGVFSTNLKTPANFQYTGENNVELVYSEKIGKTVNQISTTYQIQVLDYVTDLAYSESSLIKTNTLELDFGEELKDYPEKFKLTFKSHSVMYVDFSKITVSGYNSLVVGAHEVSFSYNDDLVDATKTLGPAAVDVTLKYATIEAFGNEVTHLAISETQPQDETNKHFYYIKNGDLFIDVVSMSLPYGSIIDIPKYDANAEQDIYYNFEVNPTGELPNKFNQEITGKTQNIAVYIYTKTTDNPSIFVQQRILNIRAFGIVRWKIKGIRTGGSYESGGTEDEPLTFDYGNYDKYPDQIWIELYDTESEIASYRLNPSKVVFDENVVDEKQELDISFIGDSKPKTKVGEDWVDQKFWIKIKDVVEGISIEGISSDGDIEINYGENFKTHLETKIRLLKRFKGPVPIIANELSNLSYEPIEVSEGGAIVKIEKIHTDKGILAPGNARAVNVAFTYNETIFSKDLKLHVKDQVYQVTAQTSNVMVGYQDNYRDYIGDILFNFTLMYAKDDNNNPLEEQHQISSLLDAGVISINDTTFSNTEIDSTQEISITHTRSGKSIVLQISVKDYITKLEVDFVKNDQVFEFNSSTAIFYNDILENNFKNFVSIRAFYRSGMQNKILEKKYQIEGKRSHGYGDNGELFQLSPDNQTSFNTGENPQSTSLLPGKWNIQIVYLPTENEYVHKNQIFKSSLVNVLVQNYFETLSVEKKPNSTTRYGYGRPINFDEIILTAKFAYRQSEEEIKLSGKDDITRSFEISYDSRQGGDTEVKITPKAAFKKLNKSAVYKVKFDAKKELEVAKNDIFFKSPRDIVKLLKYEILVFNNPAKIKDIFNSTHLTNLLDFDFLFDNIYLNDNRITMDNPSDIKSGDSLEFRNSDGNVVFKFMLVVIGDASNDGKVNQDDIMYLAHMLLMKRYNDLAYIPEVMGGDKASTNPLTSLVLRIRDIHGTTPLSNPSDMPMPINDISKTFVEKKTKYKFEQEEIIVTVG